MDGEKKTPGKVDEIVAYNSPRDSKGRLSKMTQNVLLNILILERPCNPSR